jgi:putative oligomerization/nucleic acid binding protein
MAEPGNPPDRPSSAAPPASRPGARRELRRLLKALPDALRARRVGRPAPVSIATRPPAVARVRPSAPTHPSTPVRRSGPAPAATMTDLDVMRRLTKLGSLRDAGIVTVAEFEAKKAELLRRL